MRGEGASARRKGEGRGELQGLGVSVASGIEGRPRQRLGQARAPWRAASARRLVELGRGAARRARRRRGDGTRRWRAHHGRPRVGAQPAKRHRRAAAGMPLCSAPWSTACVRELGCVWLSSSVHRGVQQQALMDGHGSQRGGGSGRCDGTGSGRGRRRRSSAALLCRAEIEKGERGGRKRESREKRGQRV